MIATTLSLINLLRGLILRDEPSICLRLNVSRRAAFFFFAESLISVADSQQVPPFFAYGICNKGDTHRTRAGPRNRRDNNTDLSDFDLRPGGLGPAQGVRIRPDAEPHPRRAGAKPRRARRRPRRPLLRFGNVGYRHHPEAAPPRRSRHRHGEYLRRDLPPVRTCA